MKVGISAIKGKIGKLLAHEIYNSSDLFDLSSALVRQGYDEVGRDIGEFLGLEKTNSYITDNINTLFENSDTVVDFSSPDLTLELAKIASLKNKTLITGTKNLNEEDIDKLKKYSESCRIVYSTTTSIGLNLLMNLLEKAVKLLGDGYDINIVEFKNRFDDINISSTTAEVAQAISKGRGWKEIYKKTNNTDSYNKEQINFATLRGGDKICERRILFNSLGEEIEFRHNITNNIAFIKGAMKAVIWSANKENGLYSMRDVLSINNI